MKREKEREKEVRINVNSNFVICRIHSLSLFQLPYKQRNDIVLTKCTADHMRYIDR